MLLSKHLGWSMKTFISPKIWRERLTRFLLLSGHPGFWTKTRNSERNQWESKSFSVENNTRPRPKYKLDKASCALVPPLHVPVILFYPCLSQHVALMVVRTWEIHVKSLIQKSRNLAIFVRTDSPKFCPHRGSGLTFAQILSAHWIRHLIGSIQNFPLCSYARHL